MQQQLFAHLHGLHSPHTHTHFTLLQRYYQQIFKLFFASPKINLNSRNMSGTTRVSWYQKGKTNLDLLEQEMVSGSGISWAMQICTSAQTDNHASIPPLSFLQEGRPSCHPTNSIKALKALTTHPHLLIMPHIPNASLWDLNNEHVSIPYHLLII